MLANRSVAFVLSAAVISAASMAYARSAAIYGGVANDTPTIYSSPLTPVDVGSGNAVGAANALISATFTNQAFRLTTSGPQYLPGYGGFSRATASNTAGTIVGQAAFYNGPTFVGNRAVRWDAGSTTPTQLVGLNTSPTSADAVNAYAINDSGMAVGISANSDEFGSLGTRAVYWAPGSTTAVELGNLGLVLGYSTSGEARAVNASGVIAGTMTKYNGNVNAGVRAVRWNPGSGSVAAQELDSLNEFGTPTNSAASINAAGTVVGTATRYSSAGTNLGTRAVRWDGGATAVTELLPINVSSVQINVGSVFRPNNQAAGYGTASAFSVNDAGTTVGSSRQYNADGTSVLGTQAVSWAAGSSTPIILTGIGSSSTGGTQNVANAINAAGLIAGVVSAYTPANVSLGNRAVVWYSPTQVLDLNTLLSAADSTNWILNTATDISDTNWVVGIGTYDPDGTGPLASYSRSFLLQAPAAFSVPEPTHFAVLGLSALGMLGRRRKA